MTGSGKPVTLEDVARAADVTVMTLSRYFRTPDKVARKTRERIGQAVDRLGYVGNATAARLAGNTRPMISVIVPSLELPYVSQVFSAVAKAAEQRDAAVMLSETHFDPARQEQLIATALSWRPTGVIFLGDTLSDRSRRMIRANQSRFVEAWAYVTDPVDISIGISNFEASRLASRALLEAGSGTLAFAMRKLGYEIERLREGGYKSAVSASGQIPVVYAIDGVFSGLEAGAKLMQIAAEDGRARRILFAGDIIAVGALFEAQRLGIRVPDVVEICGFGNYEIGKYTVPSLSTVSVPSNDIGVRAVDACFDKNQSICLDVRLIRRESASL